jgi:histidyl-tRNA synthetase
MSGVGFLWIDRIYFGGRIKSFPETVTESSKALFINYGDTEGLRLQAIQKVTSLGIKVELYPDNAKVAKQFQHADEKFLCSIVGEQEIASNFL